jgi:hypothetical protein
MPGTPPTFHFSEEGRILMEAQKPKLAPENTAEKISNYGAEAIAFMTSVFIIPPS